MQDTKGMSCARYTADCPIIIETLKLASRVLLFAVAVFQVILVFCVDILPF